MHAQESHGGFSDRVARIDFVPGLRELPQSMEGLRRRRIVKRVVAFEARNRRCAFHLRRPPHDHGGILLGERPRRLRRCLGHQQRHDRRRVPELHRPSRRSSSSARTAEAPFFDRGGLVANRSFGAPRRAGRTMPSRTRRASRLSSSGRSALTGSSRATGRPRSTISTGEPPLTLSMSALKLFLASVILAFFMMAIIAFLKCRFKPPNQTVNVSQLCLRVWGRTRSSYRCLTESGEVVES